MSEALAVLPGPRSGSASGQAGLGARHTQRRAVCGLRGDDPDINHVRQALRLDLKHADGFPWRGTTLATHGSRPFNGVPDGDPSAVGGRDGGLLSSRKKAGPPASTVLFLPVISHHGCWGLCRGGLWVPTWDRGRGLWGSEEASAGTWRRPDTPQASESGRGQRPPSTLGAGQKLSPVPSPQLLRQSRLLTGPGGFLCLGWAPTPWLYPSQTTCPALLPPRTRTCLTHCSYPCVSHPLLGPPLQCAVPAAVLGNGVSRKRRLCPHPPHL